MSVRKTETWMFTCDRPDCGMTARSTNHAALPPQWKRLTVDDYYQGYMSQMALNRARHLCPSCQMGLESYLRTAPTVIQVPAGVGEEDAIQFIRGWFSADRVMRKSGDAET